jgi:predicted ATPase
LASLDEALSLRRGEPLEELRDHPAFASEVARLDEELTGLDEWRAELLLEVGRGREAAEAAERLVRADPLRERPRAAWMRALAREGRQHEALALFQDYRRVLSSELGLEPSPSLVELETRIIQHAESDRPRPERSAGPPAPVTRLVGRAREMDSVVRLLGSTRLLTLTGPGGVGKTRLAAEISRRTERAVVWVGLESIHEPGLVSQEVAAAFGARELPGRSAADGLRRAVARRADLLVLDNCEHLVEACSHLVADLLRAAPELSILATSREPLGLPGETTWPVPPLPIPAGPASRVSDVAEAPSVELFVERAAAALPGFGLTADNAESVARICRQLDGIPLALELAAARVRILTPAEIAARLEADFDLLANVRSTLPRHKTLRATLDWSAALLAADERALLDRLPVFAGSFRLDALVAVCEADGLDEGRLLTLLSALVEKSLVVSEPRDDTTRYRLLETVRAYARERSAVLGETSPLHRRHAEWFASICEAAEPDLIGPRRAEVARRLAGDQENVRAALSWSLATPGQSVFAERIVGALWWFWHYHGRFAEARRWAEQTLALDSVPDPDSGSLAALRARVGYTAAMASWLLGDPAAAVAHGAASSHIARRVGDPRLVMRTLSAYAFALRDSGEVQAAKALATECVDLARAAGFPPAEMGFALWIHCTALLQAGDVAPAEAAAEEALDLWRATGDRWGLSMVLHGMAMARLGLDDLDAAAAYFREAIEVLRDDGEPYFVTRSLEGLAITLVHLDEPERASRLFGAAEAIRQSVGAPLLAFEQERYRKTVQALAPLLPLETRREAWDEGSSMSLEEAVAYALAPR